MRSFPLRHMVFRVVGVASQSLKLVKLFGANNSQHFFCPVIAVALRNNAQSVCAALSTLLGGRTCITRGLLEHHSRVSSIGGSCTLPLTPSNNSQHSRANTVGRFSNVLTTKQSSYIQIFPFSRRLAPTSESPLSP